MALFMHEACFNYSIEQTELFNTKCLFGVQRYTSLTPMSSSNLCLFKVVQADINPKRSELRSCHRTKFVVFFKLFLSKNTLYVAHQFNRCFAFKPRAFNRLDTSHLIFTPKLKQSSSTVPKIFTLE